ncbi:MAG: cache domain-containing protein [Bacteroidales bacterium]|nr:cache domain-containing protein [Bacteroidales bacterium]
MKNIIRADFFRKIVLPAMLAIILFVISLFAFVIPTFERNAVEQKKQMLHELTNTAWSILDKYSSDAASGVAGLAEAQAAAVAEIEALRYGREDKDYFWITDLTPTMIMHPYVQELTGQSLQEFTDPDGKKLFMEAVDIARTEGEGFISYKWQVRDDSTRVVPKLSFVKLFTPWDWVIGTGIYMDDVQAELSSLTNKLLLILLGITLTIALIIVFITYQSLDIENKRREAEEQLRESREKYRSLLESSTEGIILLLNNQTAYTNQYIRNWLGYSPEELQLKPIGELIPGVTLPETGTLGGETRTETTLVKSNGERTEALLTMLPVQFADKEGLLLTFRDISEHRSLRSELEEMRERLRSSTDASPEEISHLAASVMSVAPVFNRPVSEFARDAVTCHADATIGAVAAIISGNSMVPVLVLSGQVPVGIITAGDIVSRFVVPGGSPSAAAAGFMTSPLVTIDPGASVAKAAALMASKGVSHLLVAGTAGQAGVVSKASLAEVLFSSPGVIETGIAGAATMEELTSWRRRLPVMMRPLLNETGDASTMARILSRFNDEITRRVIENALTGLGPPPASFVFMVYGSAGREELAFNSDQDNAIVWSDNSTLTDEETQNYFNTLGTRICTMLNETGLVKCRGGYMASNPRWCRPISAWKEYFREWIVNAEPENLLNFSVFFDLRRAYGDEALFTELEDFIFGSLKERTAFFYFLAQLAVNVKVPSVTTIQVSGDGAKRKEEVIDLKACMASLVMFMRIYALNSGVRSTHTADRLRSLCHQGVLSRQTCDEASSALNFLMYHRLRDQLGKLLSNNELTNDVALAEMSETDQLILKRILSRYSNYNEILTAEFMSAFRG